jgi:fructosamine-3-kinase
MDATLFQIVLEKLLNQAVKVYSIHHLSGGEVNQSYKVVSDKGVFYVKCHSIKQYPRYFEKEKNGLLELKSADCLDVCKPIGVQELGLNTFFVLEYIESTAPHKDFYALLGEGLAKQHKISNRYFGYSEDNYLRQCTQINHRMSNWGEFFIKYRLLNNIKVVADKYHLSQETMRLFERFIEFVEFAFPEEPPSLLHGDFWKEHVISNAEGAPCLLNPSVYFGHREMDLAMTKMVGSFPMEFYEAYQSVYPLQSDWEIRLDFCKMYYHLVHFNNYGQAYFPSIQALLNKWVK